MSDGSSDPDEIAPDESALPVGTASQQGSFGNVVSASLVAAIVTILAALLIPTAHAHCPYIDGDGDDTAALAEAELDALARQFAMDNQDGADVGGASSGVRAAVASVMRRLGTALGASNSNTAHSAAMVAVFATVVLCVVGVRQVRAMRRTARHTARKARRHDRKGRHAGDATAHWHHAAVPDDGKKHVRFALSDVSSDTCSTDDEDSSASDSASDDDEGHSLAPGGGGSTGDIAGGAAAAGDSGLFMDPFSGDDSANDADAAAVRRAVAATESSAAKSRPRVKMAAREKSGSIAEAARRNSGIIHARGTSTALAAPAASATSTARRGSYVGAHFGSTDRSSSLHRAAIMAAANTHGADAALEVSSAAAPDGTVVGADDVRTGVSAASTDRDERADGSREGSGSDGEDTDSDIELGGINGIQLSLHLMRHGVDSARHPSSGQSSEGPSTSDDGSENDADGSYAARLMSAFGFGGSDGGTAAAGADDDAGGAAGKAPQEAGSDAAEATRTRRTLPFACPTNVELSSAGTLDGVVLAPEAHALPTVGAAAALFKHPEDPLGLALSAGERRVVRMFLRSRVGSSGSGPTILTRKGSGLRPGGASATVTDSAASKAAARRGDAASARVSLDKWSPSPGELRTALRRFLRSHIQKHRAWGAETAAAFAVLPRFVAVLACLRVHTRESLGPAFEMARMGATDMPCVCALQDALPSLAHMARLAKYCAHKQSGLMSVKDIYASRAWLPDDDDDSHGDGDSAAARDDHDDRHAGSKRDVRSRRPTGYVLAAAKAHALSRTVSQKGVPSSRDDFLDNSSDSGDDSRVPIAGRLAGADDESDDDSDGSSGSRDDEGGPSSSASDGTSGPRYAEFQVRRAEFDRAVARLDDDVFATGAEFSGLARIVRIDDRAEQIVVRPCGSFRTRRSGSADGSRASIGSSGSRDGDKGGVSAGAPVLDMPMPLERPLRRLCRVGFVVEALYSELSDGTWFVERVMSVRPGRY